MMTPSSLKEVRALRRPDFVTVEELYALAFDNQLLAALIAWRLELRNPRPILEKALRTAREGRRKLLKFDDPDEEQPDFDYGAATLVSFLLSSRG